MGLFGFCKKKEKAAVVEEKTQPINEELLASIEEKKQQLAGITDTAERVKFLNELGKDCQNAELIDDAIAFYEESLSLNSEMGKAYTGLMKLYNKKRAEASAAKDSEAVEVYVAKVQDLMQMSKDAIRGKAN